MSIFCTVFNCYQVFINTFKHNIFKIKNDNEKPVSDVNTQFIEYTQTSEPCRSCTDFRTFSRMRRQEFSQTRVLNSLNIFLFLLLFEKYIGHHLLKI